VLLHHLSFSVADLTRSTVFYDAVLGALGGERVFTGDTAAGYGEPGGGEKFAIKRRCDAISIPSAGFHLAFRARGPADVDAFYAAALATGGRDNGAPGLRPEYGATYYAAFVIDPDGYELEVVANGVD